MYLMCQLYQRLLLGERHYRDFDWSQPSMQP
jgi:hypothetical protein